MRHLIILTLATLFFSCNPPESKNQDPYELIENSEVRQVLEKAIEYAGGIEQWRRLKHIQYTKRSRLILEGDVLEYDITQEHAYEMQPQFTAQISWVADSINHLIDHSKDKSVHLLDRIDGNFDVEKVRQSVMSALFVLGMPYKLMDDGVSLTHDGTHLFKDSVKAVVIKAVYDPENVTSHSTSDIWWFYFEEETGKFLGSKVFHSPTYALIHNISFTDTELKFPTRRKSYRIDSLDNIQFLRAEFWYSDFEMKFK